MPAVDVEEVIRLAVASGISRDAFPSDWEGNELALYQDFTGRGTSEELARRLHEEKRSRGDWILDLGSKALLLSKAQGDALGEKLKKASIPYSTGDMSVPYSKRINRVTRDHQEILRKLAKR